MSNSDEKLKIVCLQENIKNGFSVSERISGTNLSLPILSNALLETGNGNLKISSTDLEMGVDIIVSCKVEGRGSVVAPVKLILNFINNLPNTKLQIEEMDGKVDISTDNVKTSIPIVSKEDFPIIPKIKNGSEININSKIIKRSLEQVLNSVASSDSKPEISGVLFDFKKNSLSVVATDSFRLSEKTIKNDGSVYRLEDNKSFILPQKTAQELVKILDADDELRISIGEGQVSFSFNKVNLISRVIDGDYPNYKQIIPDSFKTSITLNKDDLVSKLKLASVFSSNINDVKFLIDVKNKKFTINSKDNIKGEFTSLVDFDDITGEDTDAVFNFRYVLDGLSNITDNDIELSLNGSSAPAMIRSKKQDDHIYIVMPIRS